MYSLIVCFKALNNFLASGLWEISAINRLSVPVNTFIILFLLPLTHLCSNEGFVQLEPLMENFWCCAKGPSKNRGPNPEAKLGVLDTTVLYASSPTCYIAGISTRSYMTLGHPTSTWKPTRKESPPPLVSVCSTVNWGLFLGKWVFLILELYSPFPNFGRWVCQSCEAKSRCGCGTFWHS